MTTIFKNNIKAEKKRYKEFVVEGSRLRSLVVGFVCWFSGTFAAGYAIVWLYHGGDIFTNTVVMKMIFMINAPVFVLFFLQVFLSFVKRNHHVTKFSIDKEKIMGPIHLFAFSCPEIPLCNIDWERLKNDLERGNPASLKGGLLGFSIFSNRKGLIRITGKYPFPISISGICFNSKQRSEIAAALKELIIINTEKGKRSTNMSKDVIKEEKTL